MTRSSDRTAALEGLHQRRKDVPCCVGSDLAATAGWMFDDAAVFADGHACSGTPLHGVDQALRIAGFVGLRARGRSGRSGQIRCVAFEGLSGQGVSGIDGLAGLSQLEPRRGSVAVLAPADAEQGCRSSAPPCLAWSVTRSRRTANDGRVFAAAPKAK